MIYRHMVKIECGYENPKSVQRKEVVRQTYSIDLSQEKEIITEHKNKIHTLDYDHSDMKYLISGSSGSNICIHDMSKSMVNGNMSFHPIVHFKNDGMDHQYPENGIHCIRWYPEDTGLFITSSGDKKICIWDTNESTILLSRRFYHQITTLEMSKRETERNLIAYGSPSDPLIHFMDIRSGYTSQVLKGHTHGIHSLKWHPTKDYLMISSSKDGTIRLWDIRTSNYLFIFDKNNVIPSNDARKKKTSSLSPISHSKGSLNIDFTPDGRYLLSTGRDHEMRLWDSEFGYHLFISYDSIYPSQPSNRNNNPQHLICISNEGDIVYRSCHKVIEAFDIHTGKLVNILRGHYDTVSCLSFHPSLPQLFSGGYDKKILIWTPMNIMNDDDID